MIISVHPHVCGEHFCLLLAIGFNFGSSPRMWGTRPIDSVDDVCPRFIPTYVGNTNIAFTSAGAAAVHPHVCGEHATVTPPTDPSTGSSPRMWGTRIHTSPTAVLARFIPTYVGNTAAIEKRFEGLTVHPHVCGEHNKWASIRVGYAGSSPRMWGTLRPLFWSVTPLRFIPTYVGNTYFINHRLNFMAVHPHVCGEHGDIEDRVRREFGSSPRMWGTRYRTEGVTQL